MYQGRNDMRKRPLARQDTLSSAAYLYYSRLHCGWRFGISSIHHSFSINMVGSSVAACLWLLFRQGVFAVAARLFGYLLQAHLAATPCPSLDRRWM
jgi:hypothetical protein